MRSCAGRAIGVAAVWLGVLVVPSVAAAPDTWTPAHAMATARTFHVAVPLTSGRVLVAGGQTGTPPAATAAAEIYNPLANTWAPAHAMGVARATAAAVRLPSGKVLIAGGLDAAGAELDSAEVYDPGADTWTPVTNAMSSKRNLPVAQLLGNGKVLVAGGETTGSAPVKTADLYDPATNAFTPTGAMSVERAGAMSAVVAGGKVLVAGGTTVSGMSTAISNTAELYDPAAGTWSPIAAPMSSPRALGAAVPLPGGGALLVGGQTAATPITATATAERYDPVGGDFVPAGSMSVDRLLPAALAFPGGQVLVAGGASIAGTTATLPRSAELFNPATGTWITAASMSTARLGGSLSPLPGGEALAAGGISELTTSTSTATAERYSPPTVPGAPTAVSATAGDGNAIVQWSPPASNGGRAIDHYLIVASTGATIDTGGTATVQTLGAANGKAVTFRVRAVSSLGEGPLSAASPAVTPHGPATTPPPAAKPKLALGKKLKARLTTTAFLRGVSVRVTPNVPVSLSASLLGRTRKVSLRAVGAGGFNVVLGTKSAGRSKAARTLKVKPSRKLVGRARRFTVRLEVVATDALGRSTTVRRTLHVVPPKHKKKKKAKG